MKNLRNIILLMAMAILWAGCQPDEPPPIGEPLSKLEGINDKFNLVKVVQVDERTRVPSNKFLDITEDFLGSSAISIEFNSGTFAYTYTPGDAPDYIGGSGTWRFANAKYPDESNEYPEQVVLTNGSGEVVLQLLKPIRPVDQLLEVKLGKSCDNAASVGYIFTFERQ